MKKHLVSALLAATVVTPFASQLTASGIQDNNVLEFPKVAASEITLRGSIDSSAPFAPYMLMGSASLNGVPLSSSNMPYNGSPMPAPSAVQSVNFMANIFAGFNNHPELEFSVNGMPCGRDPLVIDSGRYVFDMTRSTSKDVYSAQGANFKFVLDLSAVVGSSQPFSLSHNGFDNAPVSSLEYNGKNVIAKSADGREAVLPGISFQNVNPEFGADFVRALVEVPAEEVNFTRGAHHSITLRF